jgi:hypothetical protein
MSLFGDFEHHLQIFVGNYIPNTWVIFNWDIYQPLLDLGNGSTPSAGRLPRLCIDYLQGSPYSMEQRNQVLLQQYGIVA